MAGHVGAGRKTNEATSGGKEKRQPMPESEEVDEDQNLQSVDREPSFTDLGIQGGFVRIRFNECVEKSHALHCYWCRRRFRSG